MPLFKRKKRRSRAPRPQRRNTRRSARQPLRSQPRPSSTPRRDAWTGGATGSIAKIDHIGPTAVATLTVTSLATDEGVAGLAGLFEDVSHSGAKSFVLDTQNLEYMDSLCLGCLVKALNHASFNGARIAVVNSEGGIHNLFRTTRIDRRFLICQNVPNALAAVEREA